MQMAVSMSLQFLQGGGDVEVSGLPTEKVILNWLRMNFEAVRSESSIIHVFPFNSLKKRGGVTVQLNFWARNEMLFAYTYFLSLPPKGSLTHKFTYTRKVLLK